MLNQSKQTKRFLIYMVIGPSAVQVITQNKTVLQALCWPEQHVCNAHTDWIHPLQGERLPYVRACCFLSPFFFFFFFLAGYAAFQCSQRLFYFFRLSLTRDNLVRKVFKANITILAQELVTQRERLSKASAHFKGQLTFISAVFLL